MCGRYTLRSGLDFLQRRFDFEAEDLSYDPRYNIAPTQNVLTITSDGSQRRAGYMRWGLIPFWAKDSAVGSRMINARSETVVENRAFKRPLQRRWCLVLADGFYEWKKEGKSRIPMYMTLKGMEPFGFAGLWDLWKSPSGEVVQSCTILTTAANSTVAPIHDRMPVVLPQEAEDLWLEPTNDNPSVLTALLIPFPGEAMEAYQVSNLVNSFRNDTPECIVPVA